MSQLGNGEACLEHELQTNLNFHDAIRAMVMQVVGRNITRENLERADQCADALLARVAALRADEWRSIETAPKDGTIVLVARDMGDPWGWVRGIGHWDGAQGIYGWICRGISDPPGELGLGHPSHWKRIGTPSPSPLQARENER